MKIEDKIVLPFIIFIISIIIIEIIFFNFMNITRDNYERILTEDTRFNSHETLLTHYNIIRDNSFQMFFKTEDSSNLDKYYLYVDKQNNTYIRLLSETTNSKNKLYREQYSIWKQLIEFETNALDSNDPTLILNGQDYKELKIQYAESMDLPKEYYQLNVRSDLTENLKKVGSYTTLMTVIIILISIMIAFEFLIIRKDMILPLKQISNALKGIRTKRFKKSMIERKDIIGEVAKQADLTSNNVKKFTNHLESEIKELKNMLRLAMESMESGSNKRNKRIIKKLRDEIDNLKHMLQLSMILLKDKSKK